MKLYHWAFILFCFVLLTSDSFADQQDSVIKDLNEIIDQGESTSDELYKAVKNSIDKNPGVILPQLLSKADNPALPESSLAVYIWAIGLTKSPEAIDDIIRLSSGKKSKLLLNNTYRALATIGGDKVGEYLLTQLEQISDQMMRYNILDLLAQIQYRPALQKTIEILEQDPGQYYWQTTFVFGKFGDIAVPFLLEKVDDNNPNIRTNAIMALGQWIIPPEAFIPLKKQFWQESSPQLRGLILSSLEKLNTNVSEIQSFSEEVIKKETDENVKRFAQETIDNSVNMKNHVETFRKQKIDDPAAFKSEYDKFFNSFGKQGDYEKLSSSSSKSDEEKLKQLRERILQRNSDECFYDFQEVNNIIILNRLI